MSSIKKGVLKNYVKFTGKHLYQVLFFNKNFFKTFFKGLQFYFKKASTGTGAFLRTLRNFQEHLFDKIPPGDCCSRYLLKI